MSKKDIGYLCLVWAFFLCVGTFGLNLPTFLIVLGSVLYVL